MKEERKRETERGRIEREKEIKGEGERREGELREIKR